MMIIDPPSVMYGPPWAIRDWLDDLATMPQNEYEVKRAIEDARGWLAAAEERARPRVA